MFQRLTPQTSEPIVALMQEALSDQNPNKLDLSIGVYFDDSGITPIMRAVKAAEAQRLHSESTKTYIGIEGDTRFTALIRDLTFGSTLPQERSAGIQTPGGSGAIYVASEVYRTINPSAYVWTSQPCYQNHLAAFGGSGFAIKFYPYLSADQTLDFDAMLDCLERGTNTGDLVILHASCHNPSGVNFTIRQWQALTSLFQARGVVPFIDLAYQGFGDGLTEDAAGLRHMASETRNAFVSVSCSKNFGLYRDRAGALFMITENDRQSQLALGAMQTMARRIYSMPPHHGAEIVKTILSTPELKDDWETELDEYRTRLNRIRTRLAASLQRYSNSNEFDFIADQRGMFSLLPLAAPQIARLRQEHSIYTVPIGEQFARINVAACPEDGTDHLAEAIVQIL